MLIKGKTSVRMKLHVQGIVQGVGFRPFVYNLCQSCGLKGYIANTSSGVDIEVEGEEENIKGFLEDLRDKKPPLARIDSVAKKSLLPAGYKEFSIKKSREKRDRSAAVTPDAGICEDCLQELFNPPNRRYLYPFINCTNCGPRYTIIKGVPYDRERTSMSSFIMCDECQKEYESPSNRRFHAEANCCLTCGPKVWLTDSRGEETSCPDPIKEAVQLLKQGKVLAVKGLGGFHLAVDATSDEAVQRLRRKKMREEKPLALMVCDEGAISKFALMDKEEEHILKTPERPIVLLRKKANSHISEAVSPRNSTFGVMLPYTPLHYLLLKDNFLALVMTSGNISDEPIVIDNEEAIQRLGGIADHFLFHDREIYLRSDDSLVRKMNNKTSMIRRSRGYVPVPAVLKSEMPPVLACGGELKNTVCLTKKNEAFLSQHIGDLKNLEALKFFRMSIEHMERVLEMKPDIIAYDNHPDYLSTKWAKEQEQSGKKIFGIQHHHAHIAGCMAENKIEEKVIGLALDGTGYGDDGTVWGGEMMIADFQDYQRIGHFEYVPIPGGDMAVKEPWRMGISYLYHTYGRNFEGIGLESLKNIDKDKTGLIVDMIEKRFNSPLTSSTGRLFDGVAFLVGLRDKVNYEGQGAMELEALLGNKKNGNGNHYPSLFDEDKDSLTFKVAPIIKGIIEDLLKKTSQEEVSLRFHDTLIALFVKAVRWANEKSKINRVALSGGCFQNSYLLSRLENELIENGFNVYTHGIVPCNDGGLSLGQAVIAGSRSQKCA